MFGSLAVIYREVNVTRDLTDLNKNAACIIHILLDYLGFFTYHGQPSENFPFLVPLHAHDANVPFNAAWFVGGEASVTYYRPCCVLIGWFVSRGTDAVF